MIVVKTLRESPNASPLKERGNSDRTERPVEAHSCLFEQNSEFLTKKEVALFILTSSLLFIGLRQCWKVESGDSSDQCLFLWQSLLLHRRLTSGVNHLVFYLMEMAS